MTPKTLINNNIDTILECRDFAPVAPSVNDDAQQLCFFHDILLMLPYDMPYTLKSGLHGRCFKSYIDDVFRAWLYYRNRGEYRNMWDRSLDEITEYINQ